MLPRTGDFPVRGHFWDAWSAKLATDCRPGTHLASILPSASARECTVVKSCHGKALGNAPRRNLVAARPPRTHRASILPLPARPRAHQCAVLPLSDAGKRISRAFCHRQAPGNAYSQRLANRAASSCGWAYCLAIALVPHESDDLFVQAVLCTRERGATSCAWRRYIVAMAGNRTEGRGALSRTWRGALNAGIRAEGADDKLAYALRQTGLHPSRRPTWAPPRIDRNIDVRRGTNPRVKRTSSACARLI